MDLRETNQSRQQQKEPQQQTTQDPAPQGKLYAVYGTLRKGFGNNALLDNEFSTLLGTERTAAAYKMVSLGGFPGVITDGDQEITIEVYRVNSETVEKRLDRLEGYPSFYQKTTIDTQWGKADMYILSEERYGKEPIVQSGDWKKYREELSSINKRY